MSLPSHSLPPSFISLNSQLSGPCSTLIKSCTTLNETIENPLTEDEFIDNAKTLTSAALQFKSVITDYIEKIYHVVKEYHNIQLIEQGQIQIMDISNALYENVVILIKHIRALFTNPHDFITKQALRNSLKDLSSNIKSSINISKEFDHICKKLLLEIQSSTFNDGPEDSPPCPDPSSSSLKHECSGPDQSPTSLQWHTFCSSKFTLFLNIIDQISEAILKGDQVLLTLLAQDMAISVQAFKSDLEFVESLQHVVDDFLDINIKYISYINTMLNHPEKMKKDPEFLGLEKSLKNQLKKIHLDLKRLDSSSISSHSISTCESKFSPNLNPNQILEGGYRNQSDMDQALSFESTRSDSTPLLELGSQTYNNLSKSDFTFKKRSNLRYSTIFDRSSEEFISTIHNGVMTEDFNPNLPSIGNDSKSSSRATLRKSETFSGLIHDTSMPSHLKDLSSKSHPDHMDSVRSQSNDLLNELADNQIEGSTSFSSSFVSDPNLPDSIKEHFYDMNNTINQSLTPSDTIGLKTSNSLKGPKDPKESKVQIPHRPCRNVTVSLHKSRPSNIVPPPVSSPIHPLVPPSNIVPNTLHEKIQSKPSILVHKQRIAQRIAQRIVQQFRKQFPDFNSIWERSPGEKRQELEYSIISELSAFGRVLSEPEISSSDSLDEPSHSSTNSSYFSKDPSLTQSPIPNPIPNTQLTMSLSTNELNRKKPHSKSISMSNTNPTPSLKNKRLNIPGFMRIWNGSTSKTDGSISPTSIFPLPGDLTKPRSPSSSTVNHPPSSYSMNRHSSVLNPATSQYPATSSTMDYSAMIGTRIKETFGFGKGANRFNSPSSISSSPFNPSSNSIVPLPQGIGPPIFQPLSNTNLDNNASNLISHFSNLISQLIDIVQKSVVMAPSSFISNNHPLSITSHTPSTRIQHIQPISLPSSESTSPSSASSSVLETLANIQHPIIECLLFPINSFQSHLPLHWELIQTFHEFQSLTNHKIPYFGQLTKFSRSLLQAPNYTILISNIQKSLSRSCQSLQCISIQYLATYMQLIRYETLTQSAMSGTINSSNLYPNSSSTPTSGNKNWIEHGEYLGEMQSLLLFLLSLAHTLFSTIHLIMDDSLLILTLSQSIHSDLPPSSDPNSTKPTFDLDPWLVDDSQSAQDQVHLSRSIWSERLTFYNKSSTDPLRCGTINEIILRILIEYNEKLTNTFVRTHTAFIPLRDLLNKLLESTQPPPEQRSILPNNVVLTSRIGFLIEKLIKIHPRQDFDEISMTTLRRILGELAKTPENSHQVQHLIQDIYARESDLKMTLTTSSLGTITSPSNQSSSIVITSNTTTGINPTGSSFSANPSHPNHTPSVSTLYSPNTNYTNGTNGPNGFASNLTFPFDLNSILPNNLFFDYEPTVIAQQLTAIDYDIFKSIRVEELCHQSWNKTSRQYLARNVCTLIQRSNRLSFWVATQILVQPKTKYRTTIIHRVISLARSLKELRNYNALMGIIAGLNLTSISRLKQSFSNLSKRKVEQFKSLFALANPTSSFKTLRDTIRQVSSIFQMPYIGTTLSDITFIEEGNPDTIQDPASNQELINLEKFHLIYTCFENLIIHQHYTLPFQVKDKDPIYHYLYELPCLSENTLHELSLVREPKT